MNARNAIVRGVADNYDQCVTSQEEKISVALAKDQHAKYCAALEKIGLQLILLEADDSLPDCCFVEDTAIVVDDIAIITNPGAPSRRKEIKSVEEAISKFKTIIRINLPATIDGGDVLKIEMKIFIGLSERTTQDAINQVAEVVKSKGYEVVSVPIHHTLHLKSVVTALSDTQIIISAGHLDEGLFKGFQKIVVPQEESYAANCLAVNDTIFIPSGYPITKSLIEGAGFSTVELENSEFKKGDGALTCLSILF